MRIQLWSYHYPPEPLGIGPVAGVLASGLAERGHEVTVVTAHPNYPEPIWGTRLRPYRQRQEAVEVLRLPLYASSRGAAGRMARELTYTASTAATMGLLPAADALVAASPSLAALLPAMIAARGRRVPWILWLQDRVSEGAGTTGLLPPWFAHAAGRFERFAYGSADRIVAISSVFQRQLVDEGIAPGKIDLIHNPASSSGGSEDGTNGARRAPRLLSIGNMGYSHGLAELVAELDQADVLSRADADWVITGAGATQEAVRAAVGSSRVRLVGLVPPDDLAAELGAASLALVGQRADMSEFNLPSRVMTLMAHGIPIVAACHPRSELAHVVNASGGGWVADRRRQGLTAEVVHRALKSPDECCARGAAARAYAADNFSPGQFAERFEHSIRRAVDEGPAATRWGRRR